MLKPTVSIIVPNYNHAPYLQERLDSILNQTYQDFEVILLDDCSTDNSREIIELYRHHPKVSHIVYNLSNSGSPFKQWVKGFDLAGGEFIWVAESDDFADLNFLQICLDKLSREDGDFVHTNSRIVDSKGVTRGLYSDFRNQFFSTELWSEDHVLFSNEIISRYLLFKNIINNASSALFRRELINELNHERFIYFRNAGDLYFYLSVLSKTNCYYIAEPLNFCRFHDFNFTAKNIENGILNEEVFTVVCDFVKDYREVFPADAKKMECAVKFISLKYGVPYLIHMRISSSYRRIIELKKTGIMTLGDAWRFFAHILLTKYQIKGTRFISNYLLRTNLWRRINYIK